MKFQIELYFEEAHMDVRELEIRMQLLQADYKYVLLLTGIRRLCKSETGTNFSRVYLF